MASYAEIFKQQKNGVFKVKEIDVSEELPEIGKMYVKELNGFTKLSIIQSRQTDTEKMCYRKSRYIRRCNFNDAGSCF